MRTEKENQDLKESDGLSKNRFLGHDAKASLMQTQEQFGLQGANQQLSIQEILNFQDKAGTSGGRKSHPCETSLSKEQPGVQRSPDSTSPKGGRAPAMSPFQSPAMEQVGSEDKHQNLSNS